MTGRSASRASLAWNMRVFVVIGGLVTSVSLLPLGMASDGCLPTEPVCSPWVQLAVTWLAVGGFGLGLALCALAWWTPSRLSSAAVIAWLAWSVALLVAFGWATSGG